MAKKPTVHTVAPSRAALKKTASALSASEEQALRMHHGVGLATGDRLATKAASAAGAAEIAELERQAFRAVGHKIYGIGGQPLARAALHAAGPKAKIIKALKKR